MAGKFNCNDSPRLGCVVMDENRHKLAEQEQGSAAVDLAINPEPDEIAEIESCSARSRMISGSMPAG